jgi:hypothetical protein
MKYRMPGPSAHTNASRAHGFNRIALPGCPVDLALDLLQRCGMMQQSEGRLRLGREVQRSSPVTARALKHSPAALFVGHSAKNTRYVVPAWRGNHVPVGEPFWSNPASKRKDLAATIRLFSGHASR